MRYQKGVLALALLVAVGLQLHCSDGEGITGPDPTVSPSPAPSPTPTPRPSNEELCRVQKITIELTVDGKHRFVLFLGDVAVFHASITHAGETVVLDPPFDPNVCPQALTYFWHKSGPAAGAADEQGNRKEQDYRLVPKGGGDLTVDVHTAGYENVQGTFDTTVKQNLAALTTYERLMFELGLRF